MLTVALTVWCGVLTLYLRVLGAHGMMCVDCDTIYDNVHCGYWYVLTPKHNVPCNNGTCLLHKGTYRGGTFYERKCFKGTIEECESKDDFIWHEDFKISMKVCCNETDFCNDSSRMTRLPLVVYVLGPMLLPYILNKGLT